MVREDMKSVGVVKEDVVNRGVWRKKTRCTTPNRESRKEKKKRNRKKITI